MASLHEIWLHEGINESLAPRHAITEDGVIHLGIDHISHPKRVVMIGQSQSGKSLLMDKLNSVSREDLSYSPTIGVQCLVEKRNGLEDIQFWEISGHETYRKFIELYIERADVVLLVFNMEENIESIEEWIDMIPERLREKSSLVGVTHDEGHAAHDQCMAIAEQFGLDFLSFSTANNNTTHLKTWIHNQCT